MGLDPFYRGCATSHVKLPQQARESAWVRCLPVTTGTAGLGSVRVDYEIWTTIDAYNV